MGFARAADVPVILTGDIDRGGVIAQLVGTQAVLDPDDAAMIKGFLINKFRGDPRLFDDGYRLIEARTGWPGLGGVPWFPHARRLPAEDAADLGGTRGSGALLFAVPQLNRIANFDDLDPLAQEPGVMLRIIKPGQPLPVEADLIILPGSKATIADLAHFRAQGWDIDLAAALRRGARVLGLCGGYQMLGRTIADPEGIEGPPGTDAGLGLLDIATVMAGDKRLARGEGVHEASGQALASYEIHLGQSEGPDAARPFARIGGRVEGAGSPDGLVQGTYLHGLFAADGFRAAWVAGLGAVPAAAGYAEGVEATLDALARHLEAHLDVDAILRIAGLS
jgi:adenosylcobyric acid synthase